MRNHLLDNAKGILIFAVVAGHFLESINGWEYERPRFILTSIYMFHMPAFIFLAGLTAKIDNLPKRLIKLLAILILFDFSYTMLMTIKTGVYPGELFQPYWILWFLMSLIWWLLMLPMIKKLKYPILFCLFIAVFSGSFTWIGYTLSLSRTLVFLPFFVLAYIYKKQVFSILEKMNGLKFLILLLPAITLLLFYADIPRQWYYASSSFESLGSSVTNGLIIRSVLLVTALVSTIILLVALPKTESWLSVIGRHSLAIFLFHGFFVIAGEKFLQGLAVHHGQNVALLIALVVAILTTLILAHPIFERTIRQFSIKTYELCVGK